LHKVKYILHNLGNLPVFDDLNGMTISVSSDFSMQSQLDLSGVVLQIAHRLVRTSLVEKK